MVKRRGAKKDTVNYTLSIFGIPVYHGITNKPKRRMKEHKENFKMFTEEEVSRSKSRKQAERAETRTIHAHQYGNLGFGPCYNIAKVLPRRWGRW
jgi:hypothetical protein